jgi:hypothetical protein
MSVRLQQGCGLLSGSWAGEGVKLGERAGLEVGIANSAGYIQCPLMTLLRLREFASYLVQCPCFIENLGLAEAISEVTVDAQGLLLRLCCGQVISRQPPHGQL